MTLKFDAERHEYKWHGRVVPGVTSVLSEAGLLNFGNADDDTLERARERGRIVHKLCELDDKDELVEESVDPALAGYLDAWRRFRRETNFTSAHTEHQVFHKIYGYAGTFDDEGSLRGFDALLDKKTGTPQRATGPQTAAYEAARGKHRRRWGLHLNADGTYQLRPYTESRDITVFLAALTLHNWRIQ